MIYEDGQTTIQTISLNRQAYLLRLWRENGRSPWRILLQSVKTGERQTFSDLESFVEHLTLLTVLPQDSEYGSPR